MKRWRPMLTALVVLVVLAGVVVASCSPAPFQSETVIDTVRILASRASEPRARPGDTVTLDLLAYDGRAQKPAKMNLFWLPVPCINPKGDAYYACFSQFGAGAAGDAGRTGDAGASLVGALKPGVDLTPVLASGASFTFKMPADAVIPRNGSSPYGLVILFNFACAGHIELVPFDPNSQDPQQIPVGCFDSNHTQLGADDFVFGFTRVYAEDDPKAVNPVITQVDLGGGNHLDVDGGSTTDALAVSPCGGDADTCPHQTIGPVVPPSLPNNKQVWADYYATTGTFKSTARLLYDPMATLSIPSGTDNEYIEPNVDTKAPAKNFVWIVVHDDQGGADWVTVPLQIKADGGLEDASSHDGGDASSRD
jgi:hypothetical protein